MATREQLEAARDYLDALQGHFNEDEADVEEGIGFLAGVVDHLLQDDGLALHLGVEGVQ